VAGTRRFVEIGPGERQQKGEMNRRRLLQSGAALSVATCLSASTALATTTEDLELSLIDLHFSELPSEFHGIRIGYAADLHLSLNSNLGVSQEFIERALQTLSLAKIDLLLLGGDYGLLPDPPLMRLIGGQQLPDLKSGSGFDTFNTPNTIFQRVAEIVEGVEAKLGKIAVLGNHDRWDGPAACLTEFQARGITVLINEDFVLHRGNHRLKIIGVDDYLTGIPVLQVASRAAQEFTILLSHNPDFVSEQLELVTEPNWSLALCGHTHGGQIKFRGIGAPFYNVRDKRFAEGIARVDQRVIFTTRGVGVVGLPLRLNCRPEVTVITLLGSP